MQRSSTEPPSSRLSPLQRLAGSTRLGAVRHRLLSLPLVAAVLAALDRRRSRRLEAAGAPDERAKSRWRATPPAPGLTWGVELDGDAFVECTERHGAFGADRALLEVGPGYGRILRSCLDRGVAFSSYLGLDLSPRNVEHLRASFADPRVRFELGDAETVSLPAPVDTVLASLTFKHLYPSFAAALANLSGQLSPHGLMLFDLIEGNRGYFQWDRATYVREYERPEITGMLGAAGLELVAFDRVVHDARHSRLLVVAGRG